LPQSKKIRDEFNLGELPQLAPADDKKAQMKSGFSGDTHWVTSHYTVSTDKGQTAITPGELEKQWTEGDRAHFVYRGKRATVFYPAVVSARFAVKTAKWNDVDIKVYHHDRNTYSWYEMIRGVQKPLDVFTSEFGEYPFDHVRIIEFPRFSRFVQSYPGTIPYSEAIGFIAQVDSTDRYLSGRGSERDEEVALVNADDHSYVLYDKGGVVMYMLRDYFGGDVLNKILREYLNEFKYAGSDKAYPTSVGVVNKNRYTGTGESTTVAMNDLIDVMVFDEKGEVIYQQKLRFGRLFIGIITTAIQGRLEPIARFDL
jgi:hypothetical protein